jgi:hypothetical protein
LTLLLRVRRGKTPYADRNLYLRYLLLSAHLDELLAFGDARRRAVADPDAEPLLATSAHPRGYDSSYLASLCSRLLQPAVGEAVCFHHLRHAFASWFLVRARRVAPGVQRGAVAPGAVVLRQDTDADVPGQRAARQGEAPGGGVRRTTGSAQGADTGALPRLLDQVLTFTPQGHLWDAAGYNYAAYVSDLPGPAAELVACYAKRADMERAIHELKEDFGIDRISCSSFGANAADLELKILAFNLLVLYERQALAWTVLHRAITVRRRVVAVAGQLTRTAGQ